MFFQNLDKVINSLAVRFIRAEHKQVVSPVLVKNIKRQTNQLLILHKGRIVVSTPSQKITLLPNNVFFFPIGTTVDIAYGNCPKVEVDHKASPKAAADYIKTLPTSMVPDHADVFSIIDFSAQAYNAIDFFRFVDIPCFNIEKNREINKIIRDILKEHQTNKLGKNRLLDNSMLTFAIAVLRYIIDQKLFQQKMGFRIDALMDRRLVQIFAYVTDNIKGILTNAIIADKVGLSKDYVGQFFKKITSMNLQEYIKHIRIKRAVQLLTTTNMKIQEICREVGINDFAYFCRVFKAMYGVTAKKIQKIAKNMINL